MIFRRGRGERGRGAERRLPRWARPLEVPPCPPGWRTGSPDFVGIGAQRSGTTWWYRGLEAHPRVVRGEGRPKELHYFNRFWSGEVPADFAERYRGLFPRPEGCVTGEWTPRYMSDFWSLPLLREAAPEARLLVLLRDPVERYRSGLARALRRAEQPIDLVHLSDAIWRSHYGEQLRRVFELFPREQVLVQQFERCRDEPLPELARALGFLALEPPEELPDVMRRRGRGQEKPPLPEPMRERLVASLADDVARLAVLCPELDLSLWPSFAHLAPRAPTSYPSSASSSPATAS